MGLRLRIYKKMKKLLMFDAYGTLISTGNGSIKATEKILELQDKKIDAVVFYSDWKKYHRKHIDECNLGDFVTEQDIFARDLRVLYEKYEIDRPYEQDVHIMLDSLRNRRVFPEVIETIEQLRREYRVVIASTTDTDPLIFNMKQNNLVADAVYTSEIIKKYKPSQLFYQYILNSEKYKAEDAVFVGDSLLDDVEGPQGIGMTTIWVDRKNKYTLNERVKPDYIVNNIAEILDIKLD
ncbi:MAG: HAD family hydrolase [Lachnospiraceae bacterium]|nr:HAD family hydrolase [Lachnospiraceae bacterium]